MDMMNADLNMVEMQKIKSIYSNWINFDLSALAYNYRRMRESVPNGTEIVSVVKANAYGHGVCEVVDVARREGIRFFGVANFLEAIELREHFPDIKILVLDVNFPWDADTIFEFNLRPVVYTKEMIHILNERGRFWGKKVQIHLKIDTGMGRVGVWHKDAISFIKEMLKYDYVEIEALCSHFAASESDDTYSRQQYEIFSTIVEHFRCQQICFPYYHIANSAGTFKLRWPGFNMVRVGIMTYGLMPRVFMKNEIGLKPVMSWKTMVIHCKRVEAGRKIGYGCTYVTPRETQIVTVPVGYADGYIRSLSSKGIVLINGNRYPVVGRVAMDHFMVDVGPDAEIHIGDEVTLVGHDNSAYISCEELADLAGTIPYEITCNAGRRAERNYFFSE